MFWTLLLCTALILLSLFALWAALLYWPSVLTHECISGYLHCVVLFFTSSLDVRKSVLDASMLFFVVTAPLRWCQCWIHVPFQPSKPISGGCAHHRRSFRQLFPGQHCTLYISHFVCTKFSGLIHTDVLTVGTSWQLERCNASLLVIVSMMLKCNERLTWQSAVSWLCQANLLFGRPCKYSSLFHFHF